MSMIRLRVDNSSVGWRKWKLSVSITTSLTFLSAAE